MAEKAAHLSPVAQIRPSLFDFFAADSLDALLYPICRKIAAVLATQQGLAGLPGFFTEIYFLGYSALQFIHLKSYGATFSEKFYGLKRTPLKKVTSNQLGKRELFLSVIAVGLIPYLKQKLKEEAENFSFSDDTRDNSKIYKKLIINSAKIISGICMGAEVIQSIKYLSGSTNTLSLLHWFSRVQLSYKNDELNYNAREVLPFLIRVAVFFYQFLQMMPNVQNSGRINYKMVEPPKKTLNETQKKIQEDTRNLCPLCGKERDLDTVLSTSGYVFCFDCITSYLIKHNHCPVTKLSSSVDNLIRIIH